jgi:predicted RND superfamily exporter protein
MRNKIEEKLIKLAYNNQGLIFGIFSALVILSIFGAILGLLILGGYV